MKKRIALLLVLAMCLSLAACGSKAEETTPETTVPETTVPETTVPETTVPETTVPETTAPVPILSAEQQLIFDVVQASLGSEEFANRQSLYKEFTGSEPRNAEIAKVVHYSNGDFDGVAVDGYLVSIAADVAWWHNEAAQEGAAAEYYNIFVDSNSKAVYDSITTDAGNAEQDIKTDEGRAIYLLWVFGNILDGSYEGNYCNDSETAVEMTADEISLINAKLNK